MFFFPRMFTFCLIFLMLHESVSQESGDGNRLVTLVIETLANVLEGKFDEGQTAAAKTGADVSHFVQLGSAAKKTQQKCSCCISVFFVAFFCPF